MPVKLIVIAALAVLAACGSKSPYACTDDTQCVRAGDTGVCAGPGFCAFADPACDGGFRFEDRAGDGLANTCTAAAGDGGVDALGEGSTCIADVAFGRRFGCILKTDSSVWCSGENVYGQLGFGLAGVSQATAMQVRDVSTAAITDATAIGLGREHACAVRGGGSVWCWGRNQSGQLGNGTTEQSAAAVQVIATDGTPLAGMVEVDAGYNHSCARTASGEVYCWGANGNGSLGDGTTASRSQAAPVLVAAMGAPFTGALELHVGGGHACVRKLGDELWCWGKNNDGTIGDGTNEHRLVPVQSGTARAIATSLWSTCRVAADSTIACHGWNRGAAFSIGAEEGFQQGANYLSPTQALDVPGGNPVTGAVAVAMGSGLCAIMSDTSVRCSGDGQYGQNGTGQPRRVLAPVMRADGTALTGVERLVAKWPHVCARKTTGTWDCWGRNTEGEFGDGTFDNRAFAAPLRTSCP